MSLKIVSFVGWYGWELWQFEDYIELGFEIQQSTVAGLRWKRFEDSMYEPVYYWSDSCVRFKELLSKFTQEVATNCKYICKVFGAIRF